MQVVLVYLLPFRRNLLLKCTPQQKITKTLYFGVQSRLKSLILLLIKRVYKTFY